MNALSTLVTRFAKADLPLALAGTPIASGRGSNAEIVQLDIERRRRAERFRLWRGHADNRVEALGVDRSLRQLVLLVDEPRRRFELEISPWGRVDPSMRVVRKEGRRRWIEQWTPARKRHFLCGMDEAHLFIAELPRGVSTVRDAHAALRNPALDALERRADGRTIRQGEWFFIPLSVNEEALIEGAASQRVVHRRAGIAQAARLRRLGRPHVADEVFFVREDDPRRDLPRGIFVRGAVRHPDHKTLVFRHWSRVLANTEASSGAPVEGVYWVD